MDIGDNFVMIDMRANAPPASLFTVSLVLESQTYNYNMTQLRRISETALLNPNREIGKLAPPSENNPYGRRTHTRWLPNEILDTISRYNIDTTSFPEQDREAPYYNRGIYDPEDGGDEAKLAVGLEPGKAYVQGYEIKIS